jgi:hypothetical protein
MSYLDKLILTDSDRKFLSQVGISVPEVPLEVKLSEAELRECGIHKTDDGRWILLME